MSKIFKNQLRGRGAQSNPPNRYELYHTVPLKEDWLLEEPPQPLKTELIEDHTRTIINFIQSTKMPFDRSINPYRGCEHGCIYCFARPSHAFLGYSPGLDFETRILYKPDAVRLLRKELAKSGYRPQTLAMGTNTDPYQPVERQLNLTRGIIEVLHETRHPLSLVTKGALIMRDVGILGEMAAMGLVHVSVSITTLDYETHRAMEPRAAAPGRRLVMIETLARAGIPVSVLAAPMIPKINDHELESILQAAKDAGAQTAYYQIIRLPLEVQDLFHEWLFAHYPDRAQKVIRHIERIYAMPEQSGQQDAYRALIESRFRIAEKKCGLARDFPKLRVDLFRKPSSDPRQMRMSF